VDHANHQQASPACAAQRAQADASAQCHVGDQDHGSRHELQEGAGDSRHVLDELVEQNDGGVKDGGTQPKENAHQMLAHSAAEQKETFGSVLERAMEEDCSLRVVRSVHNQVRQLMEAHKEEKKEEPLVITKETAGDMLRYVGVPEERVTAFEEKYEEAFGEQAEITPKNLVETNRFQIKTPEVKIQVNAEHSELVETRVIDGVRYILIRADHEVEINGVEQLSCIFASDTFFPYLSFIIIPLFPDKISMSDPVSDTLSLSPHPDQYLQLSDTHKYLSASRSESAPL